MMRRLIVLASLLALCIAPALAGNLNVPAFGGDVSNGGPNGVALTIQPGAVTAAKMAPGAAVGNGAAASGANPDITSLTALTSIAHPLAIGATSPDASALLDLTSTTRGLLQPRMTATQRLAIPSPHEGLSVYDLTNHASEYFNGSAWVSSATAGGANTQLQFNSAGSFSGWANGSINAGTGALTLTNTLNGAATGDQLSGGWTFNDPSEEIRTVEHKTYGNLTNGNGAHAVLSISGETFLNPGVYSWAVPNSVTHHTGVYGYASVRNSTSWTKGACTIGSPGTCPGGAAGVAGVLGQADNHGTGELGIANDFLAHSPLAPPPGGETDNFVAYNFDGAYSGTGQASLSYFLVGGLTPNYSGFGTNTPWALGDFRGGDIAAQTVNGYITGTTMCLDAPLTGAGLLPDATITYAGVTQTLQIRGSAPADVVNGYNCWTLTASVATAVADGTPITITNHLQNALFENYSAYVNSSESGFLTCLGCGTPAVDGGIVERFDNTNPGVPLADYYAWKLKGDDVVYVFSNYDVGVGNARVDGIDIGYGAGGPVAGALPNPLPYRYNVSAKVAINSDGNYYASGVGGVSCPEFQAATFSEGLAVACGGYAPPVPGYAGTVLWWGNVLAAGASVAGTPGVANSYYCAPFLITNPATIEGLALTILTPSTGNSSAALAGAIYGNRVSSGANRPGALIDSGATAFATGAAATVSVALANTTDALATPGLYWTCTQKFDGVATFAAISPTVANIVGLIGSSTASGAVGPNPLVGVSTTGSAFNTWPTFNNSTVWAGQGAIAGAPLMAVQVASSP